MNETSYAKGITAEHLRIFLDFWPRFAAEAAEAQQMLIDDKEFFFGEGAASFSWCHLYELPIKQHSGLPLMGFVEDEKFGSILRQLNESPNQIAAFPEIINQVSAYIDSMENPTEAEIKDLRPFLAGMLSISLTMYHTLRCVLYHGCFLNELIERVRMGDDKALFDAIRIDSTVIGCKSIIERISKAALLKDNRFFARLKAAMNGKLAKRELANFQKMRMVLEVLHEAGSTRLNDEQLHDLFVKELKLYSGNEMGGGSTKALRHFADTYMKKNATS